MSTTRTTATAKTKARAKTQATSASVDTYLASRGNEAQQADARTLVALFASIVGEPPRMWGTSIVGFGSYHYRYDSGREGESCLTGFAIRSQELVIYLAAEGPNQAAGLAQLGKHRAGQACLYVKRLADLDLQVLARLVADSVAEVRRRHPSSVAAP